MPLLSQAFAQASNNSTEVVQNSLMNFVPLILIFVVFYFFLIRPQQKKVKSHRELVNNLKKGDAIVANGIIAIVSKASKDNDIIYAEIARGIVIQVSRFSVSEVINDRKIKLEYPSNKDTRNKSDNKKFDRNKKSYHNNKEVRNLDEDNNQSTNNSSDNKNKSSNDIEQNVGEDNNKDKQNQKPNNEAVISDNDIK